MYILADKLWAEAAHRPAGHQRRRPKPTTSWKPRSICSATRSLDLENMIPDLDLLPHGGAELPPSPITVSALYFCIPPNDDMLQYWDTVADRLFKIRHCQNIDGVESILALFSPPIDPGALVRAAAAGLDISAFLAGLGAPLPNYRFNVMSQKATELVQQVGALGNSLLRRLEKRDAEALARLRSQQEMTVLSSVRAVKLAPLRRPRARWTASNKSRKVTEERRTYYAESVRYMNVVGDHRGRALRRFRWSVETAIADRVHLCSGVLKLIPQVQVGGGGLRRIADVNASMGGQHHRRRRRDGRADVSSISALRLDKAAAMAVTQGGYQRRQDEWDFQVRLADKELAQIDQQIATADLHLDMLDKDLVAHDMQIANAQADRRCSCAASTPTRNSTNG